MRGEFIGRKFRFPYEKGQELIENLNLKELCFAVTADAQTMTDTIFTSRLAKALDQAEEVNKKIIAYIEDCLKQEIMDETVSNYVADYKFIYEGIVPKKNMPDFSLVHIGSVIEKGYQHIFFDYRIGTDEEAGTLVFYLDKNLEIIRTAVE